MTRRHTRILVGLSGAILVMALLAFRWRGCLPFSGFMPLMEDQDNLGFWSRYLIYVREPFAFPLGEIQGLSFPFVSNISRGSIPLVALVMKVCAKVYAPLAECYYFVGVELLSVGLSAWLSYGLLCRVRMLASVRLLGAFLVALSPALLYRSSECYKVTFMVAYFPVLLAAALLYMRTYGRFRWSTSCLLAAIFPVAALIDYYLFVAVVAGGGVCCGVNVLEHLWRRTIESRNRVLRMVVITGVGVALSWGALFAMGNMQNLEPPDRSLALKDRFNRNPGEPYGGGHGGGFHVADVLTFIIPPDHRSVVPETKSCRPVALLARMGFPLSTAKLQGGQYEGFAYIGTVGVFLLVGVVVATAIRMGRSVRNLFAKKTERRPPRLARNWACLALGLSALLLFILSLGYVVHVGGIRYDKIHTLALWLAQKWPTFMFARSLGRLAIPLALWLPIILVMFMGRRLYSFALHHGTRGRMAVHGLAFLLMMAHVADIHGYLVPPPVIAGNDMAQVFSPSDRQTIREVTTGRKAIILVPAMTTTFEWNKTCYALAYEGGIPVSGATVVFGEKQKELMQYARDIECVKEGKIGEIVTRYGEIIIAAPEDMVERIVEKSVIEFKRYPLTSRGVQLLLPETPFPGSL